MTDTVLYDVTTTIPKSTAQKPSTESPAEPINAALLSSPSLFVEISRDNWPSAGCDCYLKVSYDGGNTWALTAPPQHINPAVLSPKQPTPTPASIGFSFDPAFPPTHIIGGVQNVPSAFQARIRLVSPA